jgi:hypothetical protein
MASNVSQWPFGSNPTNQGVNQGNMVDNRPKSASMTASAGISNGRPGTSGNTATMMMTAGGGGGASSGQWNNGAPMNAAPNNTSVSGAVSNNSNSLTYGNSMKNRLLSGGGQSTNSGNKIISRLCVLIFIFVFFF